MTWAWPSPAWWWRCWSGRGAGVIAIDDTLFRRRGQKVLILSFRVRQGRDLRGRVEDSVLDKVAAA